MRNESRAPESYKKEEEANRVQRDSELPGSLARVESIGENRGAFFYTREEIAEYVESPLLLACQTLYDKNIKTWESACSLREAKGIGHGFITIDWTTLSQENREIAREKLGIQDSDIQDYGKLTRTFNIKVALAEDSDPEEISKKASEMVSHLKAQPLLWTPRLKIEELREKYGIEPDDESADVDFFTQGEDLNSYYYSEPENIFYVNKEHYEKYKEGLKVEQGNED